MVKGQAVTVRLYGGSTAERRVVAEKSDVIVICTEEEYTTAQREGREPSGAGFPREDVIETEVAAPPKRHADRQYSAEHPRSKAGD